MNFLPSRRKVIVSIIIIAVWTLLLVALSHYILNLAKAVCMQTCSIPWGVISLLEPCRCTSFGSVLVEYVMYVVPGILYYIIHSSVQKKIK